MNKIFIASLSILLNIAGTAPAPAIEAPPIAPQRLENPEKCTTCHEGIAQLSPSHPKEMGCTICHGGEAESLDADIAHASLIYDANARTGKRNPSSLSVADKSCGQMNCHGDHQNGDRNHIERVKKSMMGNLAGMISGLRYQWAAQSTKKAKYGTQSVADSDGDVPEKFGALPHLEALPFSTPKDSGFINKNLTDPATKVSRHAGDSMLRERCFQCHIDSPPPPGEYRSQGCAACHFTYSEDGLYKGNDPTIPKNQPGHPTFHKMTALPPNSLCLTCHKGLDLSVKSSLGERKNKKDALPIFPGAGRVKPDIHFAKGFDCIDCHTQADIMGDGNIYSKQHQAVEVRCETCHGDGKSPRKTASVTDPEDSVIRLSQNYSGWRNSVGDKMVLTARNRKMSNVKIKKGQVVTLGKKSGLEFVTPGIQKGLAAHRFGPHRGKLTCTSCHSQWAPSCTGCHSSFDSRKKNLNTEAQSENPWSPANFFLDRQQPVLMVGPEGKVAPMLPQPKRTLSILDEFGKPVTVLGATGDTLGRYREWSFTNPEGYSGSTLAYAMNPHSVAKKARSCASCHWNPHALGLGRGDLKIGNDPKGREDKFEPLVRSDIVKRNSDHSSSATVTPQGEKLAGSHQAGARPFNQKEISRILKASNCIPCHDRYSDRIYRNLKKSYKFEKNIQHRKLRDKILKERNTQK